MLCKLRGKAGYNAMFCQKTKQRDINLALTNAEWQSLKVAKNNNKKENYPLR